MSGVLHGVGVGPGDPELMTLRAHRLIAAADIIAYPAPDDGESFARSIAAGAIRPGAEEIAIITPMRAERFPAQAVYDQAAERIGAALDSGRDVVVICEGDPFFYGSFMYLFARLSGRYRVEVTPGVSSLTACAAAAGRPLSARNDALCVIPANLEADELERRLQGVQAAAIIKLGRHLQKVRAVLKKAGLTDRAAYVSHASLPHEVVAPLSRAPDTAPYFSMILINREVDPWLS